MIGELERLRAVLREIAILAGEDYDTAMAAEDPAAVALGAVRTLADDFMATLKQVAELQDGSPPAALYCWRGRGGHALGNWWRKPGG